MSNNPSSISRGNIVNGWVLAITLSPVSIGVTTSAEQTFTVGGLRLGDFVDVNKPTAQPGLGIGGARVSAKDTLAITFQNQSAATITPTAAEVYTVFLARPENLSSTSVSVLSAPS